jgi:hypothetical protein
MAPPETVLYSRPEMPEHPAKTDATTTVAISLFMEPPLLQIPWTARGSPTWGFFLKETP